MIPGDFDFVHFGAGPVDFRSPRVGVPRIKAWLYLPRLAKQGVVRFRINTGADVTLISALDCATHLGIPSNDLLDPTRWRESLPIQGIGGGPARCWLEHAVLFFDREDGKRHVLDAWVAIEPRKPHPDSLPSLLGCNVLQRFRLVVDTALQTVSLA